MRVGQSNYQQKKKKKALQAFRVNTKFKAEPKTHLKRLRLEAQRFPQNCNHFPTMLVIEEQTLLLNHIKNLYYSSVSPKIK